MIFIFKKIVASLFAPIPLILFLSFTGLYFLWFTRKEKTGKICVSIGVLALALLSYDPISNALLKPLENRYPSYRMQTSKENISAGRKSPSEFVVILGGGHVSDPKLPVTSQINSSSLVRLVEGIRIYRNNPGSKLILSGGRVFDPIPESQILAEVAKDLGVNENDIILESGSKDTKDEAKIISSMVGGTQFVLVTSACHMPRSMALFKRLGMNPVPAPTRHFVREKQALSPSSFFPRAQALRKAEAALHEYLGLLWAKVRRQI